VCKNSRAVSLISGNGGCEGEGEGVFREGEFQRCFVCVVLGNWVGVSVRLRCFYVCFKQEQGVCR
jgi:hypothetical protein